MATAKRIEPGKVEQASRQRLTRKRVADRLGVSVSTVRRMEGHALHPVCRRGVNYFDPAEVERLAPTVKRRPLTDGQLAATLFRFFDAGKGLREIVLELDLPPAKVRAFYAQWREPLDPDRVAKAYNAIKTIPPSDNPGRESYIEGVLGALQFALDRRHDIPLLYAEVPLDASAHGKPPAQDRV